MSSSSDQIKVKKNADVFLAVFPHLSPIATNGSNVVFSPLSLRLVVSLIAAGAGRSAFKQLLKFMKAKSIDEVHARSSKLTSAVVTDSGNARACLANGIWIQEDLSLKQSFKQVVEDVYKAHLSHVDFISKAGEIEAEVNSWVEEKTNGVIPEILDHGSISEIDRLIVVNALYFKGAWPENYFIASKTQEYDFHLLDGKSVKAPFMTSSIHKTHSIRVCKEFKALRLPYKRSNNKTKFAMYILLPDSRDGLADLVRRVASKPGFLESHLPGDGDKAVELDKFLIPKFKVSFGFEACEILKRFGVTLPFVPGGGLAEMVADFDELFMSKILQKSFIEVNEEGTMAAAVTGLKQVGAPMRRATFVADHPFVFLIREDVSGAILFLGHVLNPLEE